MNQRSKRMARRILVFLLTFCLLFPTVIGGTMVQALADGTVYEIGPGKTYATLGDFNWNGLLPGDTVLIYWQATPYAGKVGFNNGGTAGDGRITIRGVPDPATGAYPVLDAANAQTVGSNMNEDRWLFCVTSNLVDGKDQGYITFEKLEFRNAQAGTAFVTRSGDAATYGSNVAALMVNGPSGIIVDDCIFRNCTNGVMVTTSGTAVPDGTIVRNSRFYGIGASGEDYKSPVNITGNNTVVEGNHFASLVANSYSPQVILSGANLKVAYNNMVNGYRESVRTEASDHAGITGATGYGDVAIYGNTMMKTADFTTNGSRGYIMLRLGIPGTSNVYNNTMLSAMADYMDLFWLSANGVSVKCFNNIAHTMNVASQMYKVFSNTTGTALTMQYNYLAGRLFDGHDGVDQMTLTVDETNILEDRFAMPGFNGASVGDYTLAATSPCADAAMTIPAGLPAIDRQFDHEKGYGTVARTDGGSAIGAYAVAAEPVTGGTIYKVGPGQTYAEIGDVPTGDIGAGDELWIYWRDEPYNQKFAIKPDGTEEDPIIIKGIPGPEGQLPVIDGKNATTASRPSWNGDRWLLSIGGGNPGDTLTGYVTVEYLRFINANDGNQFYDETDALKTYIRNACGVFIAAPNVTVQYCEFDNNNTGVFIVGANGDVKTENVVIRGNRFTNIGSHVQGTNEQGFVHTIYSAGISTVFEGNYFGQRYNNAVGMQIKDRGAGTIIRYNLIEGGDRQINLVDADQDWMIAHPLYGNDYIYGNIIISDDNNPGNRSANMIEYGGDQGVAAACRKGTLHIYNNTIISRKAGGSNVLSTLYPAGVTAAEAGNVVMSNNIIYAVNPGSTYVTGTLNANVTMNNNWMQSGIGVTRYAATGDAQFTDNGNTIVADDANPGFKSVIGRDFRITSDMASAVALANAALNPAGYAVGSEYAPGAGLTPRAAVSLLGAYDAQVSGPACDPTEVDPIDGPGDDEDEDDEQPVAGNVYEVGPGKAYAEIIDVPWESIAKGDKVYVFARPEPYRNSFAIKPVGTKVNPVSLIGVADSAGKLPVLDGMNAVNKLNTTGYSPTNMDRGLIKLAGDDFDGRGGVVISGFVFRNVLPGNPLTNNSGAGNAATYLNNAAAIYAVDMSNVTISNCTFEDCNMAVYVQSLNQAKAPKNVTISGCDFADCGSRTGAQNVVPVVNVSAIGVVIEDSHFGQTSALTGVNQMVLTSADVVVRNNWIVNGSKVFDFQPGVNNAITGAEGYGTPHIYGNVIIRDENAGRDCVFTTNQPGEVKMYNNTIISTRSNLNMVSLNVTTAHLNMFNNILYAKPILDDGDNTIGGAFKILEGDDGAKVTLRNNWYNAETFFLCDDYYNVDPLQGIPVTNTTVISEDNLASVNDNPGFVDVDALDLRLYDSSEAIGAGNAALIPAGYPVLKDVLGGSRTDGGTTLGAYGNTVHLPDDPGTGPSPLVFADSSAYNIPASTVGTPIAAINVSVGVSGGVAPYAFSATGLPAGITINSVTGVISGTPIEARSSGNAAITVRDQSQPQQSKSIYIAYNTISEPTNPLSIFDLEAYLDSRLNQDSGPPAVIWWNPTSPSGPKEEEKKDDGAGDIVSGTPDDSNEPKQPEEPKQETKKIYTVSVRRLNIRAGAGTDSARIGTLSRGATIIAIGDPIEGKNGPWIKFELNGRIVYASTGDGKYLNAED